ncbi:kelch-like protein 41 [Haliotis rufescens]|uniref:kelch-like protein 41 n=1 Tax=Haliotis rufescens TaxID=6454 RepID=UPI00201F8998|nr:kelch-like protein 41 [Haliotis rufescens]
MCKEIIYMLFATCLTLYSVKIENSTHRNKRCLHASAAAYAFHCIADIFRSNYASRKSTMNSQQQHLLEGIQELFTCKELTNVILVAEDKDLHCHRSVLAASSPYFRAMFRDYCERDQEMVYISSITYSALEMAVKFMYCLPIEISHDNVQSILTASSMFQLDTLASYCVDHMMRAICVDNCLDVYNLGDYQCLDTLKEAAKSYILDHFSEMVEEGGMMQLEKAAIKELISSNEINVDKEETIFQFLVKWTEYDIDERKRFFGDLFGRLRLLLVDEEYICEHINAHPLVEGNPFCRAVVSMTKLCRIGMNSQDSEEEKQKIADDFELSVCRRHGMFRKQMLIFSGGGKSEAQRAFSCFDPTTGKNYLGVKHHPTFDFKFKVDFYQLVTNNQNQIYFIGGIFYDDYHLEEQGMAQDSVYQYQQKDRTWKLCHPMNTARSAFAACAVEERVFVFGGAVSYPQGVPMELVEAYDPVFDLWQKMAPMPTGLSHHTATVYKDSVYVFGGEDSNGELFTTVLQYSIPNDTWFILDTQILNPRLASTAISYKDKIYILGGGTKVQNTTAIEIFDPETLKFQIGDDFPDDRKVMTASLLDDCIYVCGGFRRMSSRRHGLVKSRSVESKDMYKYDLDTHKWSMVAKLVQYGSNQASTTAVVNTKDLDLSEFISSL